MKITNVTTIQVSTETRDRLKHIARKDETYDDAINRALDCLEKGE